MSEEFDLSQVDEVYHSSPEHNIEIFHPQVSTHGQCWVYATPFLEMACAYLARWNDFDLAQVHVDGDFHLVERYPNAFEEKFTSARGSIYHLPVDGFRSFNYMEAVSEVSVKPMKETVVENAWFFIEDLTTKRNLFLHRFPSRPEFVPMDDSDLIWKAVASLKKYKKNHSFQYESSPIFQKIQSKHPNILNKVIEGIK